MRSIVSRALATRPAPLYGPDNQSGACDALPPLPPPSTAPPEAGPICSGSNTTRDLPRGIGTVASSLSQAVVGRPLTVLCLLPLVPKVEEEEAAMALRADAVARTPGAAGCITTGVPPTPDAVTRANGAVTMGASLLRLGRKAEPGPALPPPSGASLL